MLRKGDVRVKICVYTSKLSSAVLILLWEREREIFVTASDVASGAAGGCFCAKQNWDGQISFVGPYIGPNTFTVIVHFFYIIDCKNRNYKIKNN